METACSSWSSGRTALKVRADLPSHSVPGVWKSWEGHR